MYNVHVLTNVYWTYTHTVHVHVCDTYIVHVYIHLCAAVIRLAITLLMPPGIVLLPSQYTSGTWLTRLILMTLKSLMSRKDVRTFQKHLLSSILVALAWQLCMGLAFDLG